MTERDLDYMDKTKTIIGLLEQDCKQRMRVYKSDPKKVFGNLMK